MAGPVSATKMPSLRFRAFEASHLRDIAFYYSLRSEAVLLNFLCLYVDIKVTVTWMVTLTEIHEYLFV